MCISAQSLNSHYTEDKNIRFIKIKLTGSTCWTCVVYWENVAKLFFVTSIAFCVITNTIHIWIHIQQLPRLVETRLERLRNDFAPTICCAVVKATFPHTVGLNPTECDCYYLFSHLLSVLLLWNICFISLSISSWQKKDACNFCKKKKRRRKKGNVADLMRQNMWCTQPQK